MSSFAAPLTVSPISFFVTFAIFWILTSILKTTIFESKIPGNIPWPAYLGYPRWSRWRSVYDEILNLELVLSKGHRLFSSRDQGFAVKTFFGPPVVLLPPSKASWISKLPLKIASFIESADDQVGFENFLLESDLQKTRGFLHASAKNMALHAQPLLRSAARDLDASIQTSFGSDEVYWHEVKLRDAVRDLLHRNIARMILGKGLGSDEQVLKETFFYTHRMIAIAVIINSTPFPIRPVLGCFAKIALHRFGARMRYRVKPLYEVLMRDADDRVDQSLQQDSEDTFLSFYAKTLNRLGDHSRLRGLAGFVASAISIFAASEQNVLVTTQALIVNIVSFNDQGELIQKLLDEIEPVFRSAESQDLVDAAWDPSRLPLLDSCLRETLRLHQMDMFALRRKAMKDIVVDQNLTIKEGCHFGISGFSMHRDGEIYGNPLTYDPYRFVSGATARPAHSPDENYLPFGKGIHVSRIQCLINDYADCISGVPGSKVCLRLDETHSGTHIVEVRHSTPAISAVTDIPGSHQTGTKYRECPSKKKGYYF